MEVHRKDISEWLIFSGNLDVFFYQSYLREVIVLLLLPKLHRMDFLESERMKLLKINRRDVVDLYKKDTAEL